MKHTCHAWGCDKPCPPRHLMCASCWSLVKPATQQEVYRTVVLRASKVGSTWAPWWRAQAQACAEVARHHRQPNVERRLQHALDFADRLAAKPG